MTSSARLPIATMLLLIVVWFYFTPHLTARAMKSAVDANQVEELSNYVDFRSLKENLKTTLNARAAAEIAGRVTDKNSVAIIGAALASALLNPLIDQLVTPNSLALIIKGEKPDLRLVTANADSSKPEVETILAYEDIDKFVISIKKKGASGAPVDLILMRSGVATWKLAALRFPKER